MLQHLHDACLNGLELRRWLVPDFLQRFPTFRAGDKTRLSGTVRESDFCPDLFPPGVYFLSLQPRMKTPRDSGPTVVMKGGIMGVVRRFLLSSARGRKHVSPSRAQIASNDTRGVNSYICQLSGLPGVCRKDRVSSRRAFLWVFRFRAAVSF